MKSFCTLGLCLTALILNTKPANAQAPGNLREVFLQLDSNGDQVIDRNEVPKEGRDAFDRLLKKADTNKDRKLQIDEFRALNLQMREALGNGGDADALRQRLARLDKNGDGKVEKSEFKGTPELFDRLDRNNDGVLTAEDRPGGAPDAPSANTLPTALRRLDKNGNGKIERKEFPGRPAAFSRLDKNDDGSLSPQELKNANGQLLKAAEKARNQKKKP